MRKVLKVMLIVSLVLIIVGAAVFGVGFFVSNGKETVSSIIVNKNFPMTGTDIDLSLDLTDNEAAVLGDLLIDESYRPKEVKKLDVDVSYGTLEFVDSEDDQINIKIYGPSSDTFYCKLEQGELKLEDKKDKVLVKSQVNILISVPKGTNFSDVDIDTSAGDIEMSHIFHTKDMDVSVDAGAFHIDGVNVQNQLSLSIGTGDGVINNMETKELDVDCGVGSMKVSGKTTGSIDAENGMGRIQLTLLGNPSDYNYDIENGMGELTINEESYGGLAIEKKINNSVLKTIDLDNGMGEVNIQVGES